MFLLSIYKNIAQSQLSYSYRIFSSGLFCDVNNRESHQRHISLLAPIRVLAVVAPMRVLAVVAPIRVQAVFTVTKSNLKEIKRL